MTHNDTHMNKIKQTLIPRNKLCKQGNQNVKQKKEERKKKKDKNKIIFNKNQSYEGIEKRCHTTQGGTITSFSILLHNTLASMLVSDRH